MTNPGELETKPALFEHAERVYKQMVAEATQDDELDLLVYEGHLTQLFRKLLLSTPYYTLIKNKLAAMGCIEQIRRGGGNGTSRWVLWKEPELEEWKATDSKRSRQGNKSLMQEQRVKDLTDRVLKLEEVVESLTEALSTHAELHLKLGDQVAYLKGWVMAQESKAA